MALPFLPPPLLPALPFLQKLDNDALYVIIGIVLRKISANLIALNCYLSLFWLFFLQYHPDHCQRQLAAFSIFFQLRRLCVGNRSTRFLENDCYILLLFFRQESKQQLLVRSTIKLDKTYFLPERSCFYA